MSEFIITDALTFVTVIDEGSFAAAARKWFISSSIVSKRISRLENHLRVQLIQRTTRSLALTESGQLFYLHWKRIKSEISEAEMDVMQHHQQPRGLLRINSPVSFGQVHLVPAINDFIQRYPDIQIELILGSQYVGFIYSGLDLAIFIKELPNTPLLKFRKITQRSTGVYGAGSYFKKFGLPQKPEDLINHNCLIYQSEPGTIFAQGHHSHVWSFLDRSKKIKIPVKGNLRINNNQALMKAAVAGIGLAKISSFLVTEELKNGSLQEVLGPYNEHGIDIHAAYPNQRYLPFRVKLFIDFLIERFQSETYWNQS
ncbi:MAG TPA: LysR family transcriptional regulator [Gammaproteobacteria bacterium]|nr:LysR family transcriptional regulator [Gammaproteobacteria bacterium]